MAVFSLALAKEYSKLIAAKEITKSIKKNIKIQITSAMNEQKTVIKQIGKNKPKIRVGHFKVILGIFCA